MTIIPKIDGIRAQDLAPRYVWLDEDGEQVSPVHRSFGVALNFVQGWQWRWDKITEKYGPYGEDNAHRFERSYSSMTRSGKPPHHLSRLVVTVALEDCTDDERAVAEAAMRLS